MKKLDPELQDTRDQAKVVGVMVLILFVVPLAIGLPIAWLRRNYGIDESALLFFLVWLGAGAGVLWVESRTAPPRKPDVVELPADWPKIAKMPFAERTLASQSFFYCSACKRPRTAWNSCDLGACPHAYRHNPDWAQWSGDDEERIG